MMMGFALDFVLFVVVLVIESTDQSPECFRLLRRLFFVKPTQSSLPLPHTTHHTAPRCRQKQNNTIKEKAEYFLLFLLRFTAWNKIAFFFALYFVFFLSKRLFSVFSRSKIPRTRNPHTDLSSPSLHTNTSANSLELFHHQEIAASSLKKIDPTDTKIALFAPKTQPIRTNSTHNRITTIHCTFCDTIRHQTRREKREKVPKYPHLILTPCSTIQATNLCLVCAE